MYNASKPSTSIQATRSHRRDVNGMVGQRSTFNQMRTFLREICVPLQPADPLKSTASAALQNGLMFQPHSESTSFTSMGSLVRVQLSPPKRKPLKINGFFFLSLHPGVHCPGVFFVDMNSSKNTYCPHCRVGSVAGKSGWLLWWKWNCLCKFNSE